MNILCVHPESGLHAYKLKKIRNNVLENMYKGAEVDTQPVTRDNPRLRLRFKEAIREAHEICSKSKNSYECHLAWYEVDELDDCMSRQNLKD